MTDEKLSSRSTGTRIRRRSATLAEVPPFCFLRPGLAIEEAAAAAVQALGIRHRLEAVQMLWKLQARS